MKIEATNKVGVGSIIYIAGRKQVVDKVDGKSLMYSTPWGRQKVSIKDFVYENNLFKYVPPKQRKVEFRCVIGEGAIRNFSGVIEDNFITSKNPEAAAKGYIVHQVKKYNNAFSIQLLNFLIKSGKVEFKIKIRDF